MRDTSATRERYSLEQALTISCWFLCLLYKPDFTHDKLIKITTHIFRSPTK